MRTVRAHKESLALILDRYEAGDTNRDKASDQAVLRLRTSLWLAERDEIVAAGDRGPSSSPLSPAPEPECRCGLPRTAHPIWSCPLGYRAQL